MKFSMTIVLISMFSISCGLTQKENRQDLKNNSSTLDVTHNEGEMSLVLDLPGAQLSTSQFALNSSSTSVDIYNAADEDDGSENVLLSCAVNNGTTSNQPDVNDGSTSNQSDLDEETAPSKDPLEEQKVQYHSVSSTPYTPSPIPPNFVVALQKKSNKGSYDTVSKKHTLCNTRVKVTLNSLKNETYRLIAYYTAQDVKYEGVSSSFSKNENRVQLVMKKVENNVPPIVDVVWERDITPTPTPCPAIARMFFLCKEGKEVDSISLGVCGDDVLKGKNLLANGYQTSSCKIPEDKEICTDVAGVLINKYTGEKVDYSNGCELKILLDSGKYKN